MLKAEETQSYLAGTQSDQARKHSPAYLVQSDQAEEIEQEGLPHDVRSCPFCLKHMYLQVALLQQMRKS